jgi:hypothetical protein
MFDCNEDRTADDRRDAEKSENWTFTFPVSGEEGAAQCCDKLDRPKGYVEEDRLEGVIAERLDNERSESGDATTWDARESELAEFSQGTFGRPGAWVLDENRLTRSKISLQTRTKSSYPESFPIDDPTSTRGKRLPFDLLGAVLWLSACHRL